MFVQYKKLYLSVILVIMSIAALSVAAFDENAKVYKIVHKDGSVSYSDQGVPEAEEMTLNVPMSTMQSGNQKIATQPHVTIKQKTNYQVSIVSPQADATIRSNQGELSIVSSIEPKINGLFQLTINDQIIESATGVFQLEDMHRGAYQYSVKFIDNSGKVLATTQTRNLYLHQASALIN